MIPQDPLLALESELLLIGAAMYSPTACEAALEQLGGEHFGEPIHGLVWDAIKSVVAIGRAPTPEIVRDRIGIQAGFQDWGGFDRLWELWDRAQTGGVAGDLNAVADRAGRRAIKSLVE